jgi:hypothetical protein
MSGQLTEGHAPRIGLIRQGTAFLSYRHTDGTSCDREQAAEQIGSFGQPLQAASVGRVRSPF